MRVGRTLAILVALASVSTEAAESPELPIEFGRGAFANRNDPPAFRPLSESERAATELGHEVFNSHFVPAGTPGAGRLAGLGPLYNAPSCDACHNEGARGAGPSGDGEVPVSLVLQLAGHGRVAPGTAGDSVYGRTLNTTSVDGVRREGRVFVHYEEQSGFYADGTVWRVRVPHYEIREPSHRALASDTVLMPRLAPALFGVGLLEEVRGNAGQLGRFGWRATTITVRDQTTTAFAREMGLTSADAPADDCTPAEEDCQRLAGTGPDIADSIVTPLVQFEQLLAVPTVERAGVAERKGMKLFRRLGCDTCHVPALPIDTAGSPNQGLIYAYTDLKVHDLGSGLADRDVATRIVPTRWRTAPLWAIGYRPRPTTVLTFLHDGRARSIAEAILWHEGEAHAARRRFLKLNSAEREQLKQWVLAR